MPDRLKFRASRRVAPRLLCPLMPSLAIGAAPRAQEAVVRFVDRRIRARAKLEDEQFLSGERRRRVLPRRRACADARAGSRKKRQLCTRGDRGRVP
jgi:hypothetical protein